MSVYSRVIWSEGLFLRPQHFQQQDRYFERYVETRCEAWSRYSWGFTELEIERDLLGIGKLGLRRLAGVFPDGTPFRMPEDAPLPAPLDVGARGARSERSASPCRCAARASSMSTATARCRRAGAPRASLSSRRAMRRRNGGNTAMLEVAALRTRLLLDSDVREAYACIPLAHVVECRADSRSCSDDRFIPTVLHARAATRLATFMTELLGLLHQRGEALGGRVSATGRGARRRTRRLPDAAERSTATSRCSRIMPTPVRLHPGGALSARASPRPASWRRSPRPSKRPPKFPGYRTSACANRSSRSWPRCASRSASCSSRPRSPIPLEPKKYGITWRSSRIARCISSAVFVLAARADMPGRRTAAAVPRAAEGRPGREDPRPGNSPCPACPSVPVPVAPRQIPFHAGFVYFELDQTHELWEQLKTSGGVAMHVAGEFPGLTMEFWAIRG